ncbi:hypothetical protein A1O7_00235 [Cladophialophora yegresii CBS 114405]|uniref:Clr5 domain-containing protein n=1 Tax=Cladophialophora yegresii CBS 114405 TaxID=1182544 RepID=W9WFY8_9EURO|nr:uncharacterized protein A1O7_00235 [Cladophialophora yegresii CBS 114405]EXJ63900.1 hypothetical protein A1O7_00235 [Cladophialophora yegresii CBS 114405]
MPPTDQPRRRKKAPSEAEWNRIRPEFERLYLRKRLTLARISAILAKAQDFHAAYVYPVGPKTCADGRSPYMYKLRISKWGLKKSFRREELEAAASILGHFVRAGLNPPTAMIDNRKVPIERAKRHFRASFCCEDEPSSGGTTVAPGESSRRDSDAACAKRTTQAKLGLRRRSQTVPRVLLQQSAESHHLESTLAAVNNYFTWRLSQTDDYFVAQKHGAGEHSEASELLDPYVPFSNMAEGMNAAFVGTYHHAQSLLRRFCGETRVLLLQQHPLLLETLVYSFFYAYNGVAGRFMYSIISYLAALASRLFGHDHPISMTLKLLRCYEARRKGTELVSKLLYEITKRQKDPGAQKIFELEYNMAQASVFNDDFHTAAEICQALLQRYMDRFDERHRFCRGLMILQGELHWKHRVNDEARQIMLKVVELDDSYVSDAGNADGFSAIAMGYLGELCEDSEDLAGAERWYSQAYEVSCDFYGREHVVTENSLFKLQRIQRRLNETAEEFGKDQIDETEIFKELERQIERLDLEESPAEGECEGRAAPWNDWQADVPDANKSSHASTDGSTYEEYTSDTALERGNQQLGLRAESGDASSDICTEGARACDAINNTSQEQEKDHDLISPPQCLRDSMGGTFLDISNEADAAFEPYSCSAADPYIDAAAALLTTPELPVNASAHAFIATQSQTFPQDAQDTTIADLYFNTLPPLETGPEFDEFDHIKASDMVESDTMILDTDGNLDILNPGFFDCSILQDWYALDGLDAVNSQERDINWGDLMLLEEEQGGM